MEILSKNKYARRAKISEYKFRKMLQLFADDLSATQIALKISINRNTVNRYLNEIRERIVEFCEQNAPFHEENHEKPINKPNEQEVTKITSSLSEKISSNLGILKRRGKVYAEILTNCTTVKLRKLANAREIAQNITVHAVDIKPEDGLIAVGYDHNKAYADKPSYVGNLDKFWEFVKNRTSKFQGVAKHKFYLHLKESEFRFNFRNDNLYEIMLKLLSARPIS